MVLASGSLGSVESVVQALRRRAELHPERTAIAAGAERLSYLGLWEGVQVMAEVLGAEGLQQGERVLLAAEGNPTFAIAYLATHLAGGIAVPIDPTAPEARGVEIARRSRPRFSVGVAFSVDGVTRLDPKAPGAGSSGARAFADPSPSFVSDLMFTTGTTGVAKGVPLTHANVVAAATHINQVIGNGDDDVEVAPLPLSHSFGLGRLRCNLLAGGTLVLVQGFKMPGEIFAALKQHRASGLVGVPAGFAVLLRFGARGLGVFADQLRYVEIGSALMPLEQKRQLVELLPKTRLFMHYGLTEASRSAFMEFHRDRERLHTIGVPAPGVAIEIRDDEGRVCADGVEGTLWIRGPHTASSYWEDPERSALMFVDSWVRTNDLAIRAADGVLTLRGRRDDVINVGGFKVSPEEVESVLESHAAVAEAACIGIADPRGVAGEIVCAYLVVSKGRERPSDDELQRWTAERLEAYKVPGEFRWAETLPRTSSGKLQRATLRTRSGA